jgi:hypothetical protein
MPAHFPEDLFATRPNHVPATPEKSVTGVSPAKQRTSVRWRGFWKHRRGPKLGGSACWSDRVSYRRRAAIKEETPSDASSLARALKPQARPWPDPTDGCSGEHPLGWK